jgi:hypothetical protein
MVIYILEELMVARITLEMLSKESVGSKRSTPASAANKYLAGGLST